ncbi:MAG: hypothetical protein Q9210_005874 [Variospora velana]
MSDLTFNGGLNAAYFGNQQLTVRNCTINNANNAINMVWDWGWTFQSISINNCSVGLNITNKSPAAQTVGSVTFIDSSIANTPLQNALAAVQGIGNGDNPAWHAEWWFHHDYHIGTGSFLHFFRPFHRRRPYLSHPPPPKPAGQNHRRCSGKNLTPQYESVPASQFLSARAAGATGDGKSDDTRPLQDVFIRAASERKIVFLDAGIYSITWTLYIPTESKIFGEAYPVILSSGSYFANKQDPTTVVQVGKPGETGCIELSDFIVSTQGAQAGAIGIEWNIESDATPSGMWDVHVRIGGFAGSNLQIADCPAMPDQKGVVNEKCIGAHTSMYVRKGVRGLYMENVWLWTADHDLDYAEFKNITVYNGRGLNMQAERNVWL